MLATALYIITIATLALSLGSLQYLRDDLGSCKTLAFTNGTGAELAGGAMHTVGNRIGPVLETTPDGEGGVIITETKSQGYSLPKAGIAVARGANAYWDDTNDVVTNTDNTGANRRIGYFAEDAAAGDARVQTVIEQSASN